MNIRLISPEETHEVRNKVLWPHLSSPDECVIDVDELEDTFHVGAETELGIVGTSTWLAQKNEKFDQPGQYRLRAMGTLPEVKGKNAGRQIVEFAIEELRNRNIDILWCDAREVALGFYEKMGFTVIGDFYDVPKIGPHKLMYIEIETN